MRRLILALVLVAGCKSGNDNGYAVNLTVVVDSAVPSEVVQAVRSFTFQVSGAEDFSKSLPVTNELSHGKVNIIYRPGLSHPGDDVFVIIGADSDANATLAGEVTVSVVPRKTVSATLTLSSTPPSGSDGGEDGGDGGSDGSTVAKKQGEACRAGVDVCESGFCVDGVCCNAACDDACLACNVAGSEGVCTPVVDGQTPVHSSCPALAANDIIKKCSTDGKCDGKGQCRLWAANTSCGGAVCDPATNLFTPGALCDGAGRCVQPPAYNCKPYKCNGTSACFNSCDAANNNAECCTDTSLCGGVVDSCVSNSCGKKPLGRSCMNDNECDTPGLCVDGVCCNSACTGQCEACDADVQQLGTCLPITASGAPHLTNGRSACLGGGTVCQGSCDGTDRTICKYGAQQCYSRSCSSSSGHAVVTNDAFCSNGTCAPTTTDCTMTAPGMINTSTSCDPSTHACSYSCLSYYANCAHPGSEQTEGCPDPLSSQSNCGSCGNNCTANLSGSVCSNYACQCTGGQVACISGSAHTCFTPTSTNCCRPNGANGCGCGGVTCNHYHFTTGCGQLICYAYCDQWSYTCNTGDCGHSFIDTRFNDGSGYCNGYLCYTNGNSESLCSINPS